jgi:hypothetical protein
MDIPRAMSIERHSRARQIELGQALSGRRKIYLDARFWVILRDVALGISAKPGAHELLRHLRCGVASGRLVCPISASMFLELMKQRYTSDRRIGTAQLIDELSLGTAMIPPQTLMETEICVFLLRAKGNLDLHPMQELIWTKVACVLGNVYPSLTQLSPSEELATQKAFFDYLWNYPLSDMVKTIGDKFPRREEFVDVSRETNEKNEQYKDEVCSFSATYDIELRGGIELATELAEVIHQLDEDTRRELLLPRNERANTINMYRNKLYNAFKEPETKHALRCLHIGASIHAAMRWDNRARKFVPNDYYDFEHAIAALSYCDAFLTEKPLRHLVTLPHVNLQALNNCRVFSDIGVATDYIRELSFSASSGLTE